MASKITSKSCIAGIDFHKNLEENKFLTLSAFLVIFTLPFALVSLGNNIQGNRLPMVFLIVFIIIIQNSATIIL